MNRSPIRFILQRPGMGPEHDDILEVHKVNMRCYEVVYHDKDSDYQTRVVLDEYSTLRHIQTMLDLLCVDVDPFDYCQVDVPACPSIQFKIPQLNSPQIRSNIFGMMKNCMRSWPTTTRSDRMRAEHREAAHPPGDA